MSAALRQRELDFAHDGAALFPDVFSAAGLQKLAAYASGDAGARLLGMTLAEALTPATRIAAKLIGARARPVRAVMFDKTAERNWALGWHQDRTIAVQTRIDVEGFGPWTLKQGILHVAPPIDVLERMATLRIHVDRCGADNAPLKVALGSHRLGAVPAGEAATRAANLPRYACLAEPGDVWAYATPILHGSDRAERPLRRRVLQVDFAAFDLPQGLAWKGLA